MMDAGMWSCESHCLSLVLFTCRFWVGVDLGRTEFWVLTFVQALSYLFACRYEILGLRSSRSAALFVCCVMMAKS